MRFVLLLVKVEHGRMVELARKLVDQALCFVFPDAVPNFAAHLFDYLQFPASYTW